MAVCQKPHKLGVGMVVCRQDKLHKDYTSNTIPISCFTHDIVQWALLGDHWEQHCEAKQMM